MQVGGSSPSGRTINLKHMFNEKYLVTKPNKDEIVYDDGTIQVVDGPVGSEERYIVYWYGFIAMGDNGFPTIKKAVEWGEWALKNENARQMMARGKYQFTEVLFH